MTLKELYAPEKNGAKVKYDIIIAKLLSTIAKHKLAFPHLSAVEKFLTVPLPETEKEEDYLQRLDELCAYLNEISTGSYVIRHLLHNLSADVESVRNKTFLFNQEDHYIILPR